MDKIQLDDGRSADILKDDKAILKSIFRRFKTKTAAGRALGISRNTFANALASKTCHPDTLKVVRDYAAQNST